MAWIQLLITVVGVVGLVFYLERVRASIADVQEDLEDLKRALGMTSDGWRISDTYREESGKLSGVFTCTRCNGSRPEFLPRNHVCLPGGLVPELRAEMRRISEEVGRV